MSNTDAYAWWRAAVDGIFGPVHDGHPQPGFYRRRKVKDGPWLPVAIWQDDETMACAVGRDMTADDVNATWIACAKHPVPEANYRAAVETGQWPDETPAEASTRSGHNRPPQSVPELVEIEVKDALDWLAKVGEIGSKIDGDIAANRRAALLELLKRADTEREAEKRPHLEAGRAVDAKWKPIIDTARTAADRLRSALTPWLKKLADEKAAVAAQAIAEGRDTQRMDTVARAGGGRGKQASLRTVRRAVIKDYASALQFFAEHPEIKETVQRLANKVAQVNGQVPGVEIVVDKEAA